MAEGSSAANAFAGMLEALTMRFKTKMNSNRCGLTHINSVLTNRVM